jgi:hypothetical protein
LFEINHYTKAADFSGTVSNLYNLAKKDINIDMFAK